MGRMDGRGVRAPRRGGRVRARVRRARGVQTRLRRVLALVRGVHAGQSSVRSTEREGQGQGENGEGRRRAAGVAEESAEAPTVGDVGSNRSR